MKIEFHKTGERRYAIEIRRENFPDLEMNPAPGFDELMPHDLCHLIVEKVLKIENAIFGQVFKGNTAGSFRNAPTESVNTKDDSRRRRKDKQKGEKIVKANLEDLAKSERATYVCWQNWLANSADEKLNCQAAEMKFQSEKILNQLSASERAIYNEENLAKVRKLMDELSRQWQKLKTGESMIVEW